MDVINEYMKEICYFLGWQKDPLKDEVEVPVWYNFKVRMTPLRSVASISDLNFDSSYDSLMHVYLKFSKIKIDRRHENIHRDFLDAFTINLINGNIDGCFNSIGEGVKWFNAIQYEKLI